MRYTLGEVIVAMLTAERTAPMARNKYPSSFRLSEECLTLLERLAENLGISQAGVIEQAVRKLARAELPAPVDPDPGPPPRSRRKSTKE